MTDWWCDKEKLETFEQWASAEQRQQLKWFKKQPLKTDYGTPPTSSKLSEPRTAHRGVLWATPRPEHSGNNNYERPSPRLPPRGDNTKDTSAVIQKATSEKEKREYFRQGRCFECGRRGHLARNCPTSKAKARTVQIEENGLLIDEEDGGLTPV